MAIPKITHQSNGVSFPHVNAQSSSRYKDLTQQVKSIVNGKTSNDVKADPNLLILACIGAIICALFNAIIAAFIGIAAYKLAIHAGVNKPISIALGVIVGLFFPSIGCSPGTKND